MRTLSLLRGAGAMLLSLWLSATIGCSQSSVPAKYRPADTRSFGNAEWAAVLRAVVTPDGYVRHDLIESNAGGARDALYRYVGLINAVGPDNRPELFPTEDDRLAYYINAYNALCMYAVSQRGYPSNVLLSGAYPGSIFFSDRFIVGGTSLTLDGLEKSRLRAVDPRTHFAINCMSRSCPPLLDAPYEPATVQAQMDQAGRRFLSDPRGAQRDGERVQLSKIFDFFTGDFVDPYRARTGRRDADVLESIRQYAAPDSPVHGAVGYSYMGYDWSLNRPG